MKVFSFAALSLLVLACGSSDGDTTTSSSTAAGAAGAAAGQGGAAGEAGQGGAAGAAAQGGAAAGAAGAGGAVCLTDGDKAASLCVDTFGDKMSMAFGRIDGKLHAVVRPKDQQCTKPNGAHVNLEVEMGGKVYRLLVTAVSTGADPNVYTAKRDFDLPPPAYSEGWHPGLVFDYQQMVKVHTADFVATSKDDLVQQVLCEVELDQPISVYTVGYGPDGGHNVHKNAGPGADGAIIVRPTSPKPRVLLFRFSDQQF